MNTDALSDTETVTIAGIKYRVHAAAAKFPMLAPVELAKLAADIKEHGQLDALVYDEDDDGARILLDGRNRNAACRINGMTPVLTKWDGAGGTHTGYILSKNLRRRDLTESQRALLAADLLPMLEAEAKERMRRGAELGGKVKRPPLGRVAPTGATAQVPETTSEPSPATAPSAKKAAEAAAEAVGVSSRSVERAKVVLDKATPEVVQQVREGKVSVRQAERTIRRDEALEAIKTYQPPKGQYSVIAIDPPWKFDTRADDETHRGRITYPPMELEEIKQLVIPAAKDCILFMWAPASFVADGAATEVVKAWGFTPKTTWTWCKVDGDGDPRLTSGNWGRGGTEHIIVAIKGKPLGDFRADPNWFTAPIREHSRKPDEFFERVLKCCSHPAKLEMFAREERRGWTVSGAEKGMFPAPTEEPTS